METLIESFESIAVGAGAVMTGVAAILMAGARSRSRK